MAVRHGVFIRRVVRSLVFPLAFASVAMFVVVDARGTAFKATSRISGIAPGGHPRPANASAGSAGQSGHEATYRTIDFPGANISSAWGINSAGSIIGTYTNGNRRPAVGDVGDEPSYGYLLDGGTYTSIELPNAFDTLPYAISNSGQIVGAYIVNGSVVVHCFELSGDDVVSFDVPGAVSNSAWGINSEGDIVGRYVAPDTTAHGFLRHDGRFTSIDVPRATMAWARGITASGDIVGVGTVGGKLHGFWMRDGKFTTIDAPGAAFYNGALGINERGDIVGQVGSRDHYHGYLLRDGRFSQIDFPGAIGTIARGINLRGEIVGEYTLPDGKIHAFLLSNRD